MKEILAIGGSVIKTAKKELIKYIENDHVEMLIHNGGSIFHDFQQELDSNLKGHSYSLDELIEDYSINDLSSKFVWDWILEVGKAPDGSVTKLCDDKQIPVLLFTGLGCDFWQMFAKSWIALADKSYSDFEYLVNRMKNPFHYVCMGSAVIHPEVFIKAVAKVKAKYFKADVVDFKDMYRPRTRVAKYGTYFKMTHREYFAKGEYYV